MSDKGHIVHVSNTHTEGKTHGKPTKRNPNQTHERTTRPHRPTIPQHPTHARLPNNHEDTQKLRRLLRTQHYLPAPRHTRKERLRQKHLEHERRTPPKSLPANQRWTKPPELHGGLAELHLQTHQQHRNHRSHGRIIQQNSKIHRKISLKHLLQLSYVAKLLDSWCFRNPFAKW